MSKPSVPQFNIPGLSIPQADMAQVLMNPSLFENTIKSHGVALIQSRPMQCPNVKDLAGGDHDPSCEICSNGYIYYGHKEFTGVFMGNSIQRQFQMSGTFDFDQASIIMPAKNADGTDFDVNMFDRIEMPGNEVRYFQRVEHSQTGRDRLHFPATRVDKLITADLRIFTSGVDFQVTNEGRIQWLPGGDRPGYNLDIDRGEIYSVTYYCRPVFTVISLPHQLRVTKAMKNGVAVEERFPQLAVCRKDFFPHDNYDRTGADNSQEPRDGQV